MRVRLIILNGPNPYTEFPVTANPFLVGRKGDCQLKLESQSISRHHCELKLKSAGMTVKDLGSTAGTLLNGKKLPQGQRVVMHDGDILQVGKYQFKVAISKQADKLTEETKPTKIEDAWKIMKRSAAMKKNEESPVGDEHGDETESNLSTLSSLDEIEIGGWAIEVQEKPEPLLPAEDVTYVPHFENDANRDGQTEEERRKALLEKIKSQPAKDSQEAAEQALKRMFGRR